MFNKLKIFIDKKRGIHQRAKQGWSYGDCWDFFSWFQDIIPKMLTHLANYGCGFPLYLDGKKLLQKNGKNIY